MRVSSYFLLCLFCASLVQGEELPDESQKLLDQLSEWEFKERTLLEQKIAEKRKQVVEGLERHKETYTKRGDLEKALALRKEIEKLQKSDTRPPLGLVYEMPWDEGDGRVRVEFHAEGIATYTNLKTGDAFDRGFRWNQESDRIVNLWYHTRKEGEGFRLSFSEDFSKARVRFARRDFTTEAVRVK